MVCGVCVVCCALGVIKPSRGQCGNMAKSVFACLGVTRIVKEANRTKTRTNEMEKVLKSQGTELDKIGCRGEFLKRNN